MPVWQRVRARARAAVTAMRRLDVALVVAACALVGGMYCTNSDWGGDPASPRGDGKYRPVLARGDGHLYYLMARSTVIDGDWVFDNDLARFGDPFAQKKTAAGRKGIPHPIGPTIVWAPVLAASQGLAWGLDQLGAGIPLHGYTGFHQRIVFATTVLFAWLTILLGWRAARRWVGGRWGPAFAAVAVLLGTSLAYYATYMPSYPHAMDACFTAAFLHYWVTTIGRRDVKRFAVLGVLLGAATLIRSQELALGVVVAIEIGAALVAGERDPRGGPRWRWPVRLVGLGALTLAIALACFAVQLYEWSVVYGAWDRLPQGPRFTRFGHPLVLETLFSARNGWWATTPIAMLGALGLCVLPARHRVVGAGLLAVVVVQIYLCSTVYDWWSGASFSQRRLVSMTYPLVVGLAALLGAGARLAARARVPRRGRMAIAVAGLGWLVVWNMAWVLPLRAGKPANSELRPLCCEGVPRPMRWIAEPVYRAVGNPFELPASAWFAVRHGVGIHRWDQAVGIYPLIPPLDDLADGTYVKTARGVWNLGGANATAWLVRGFGPSVATAAGAPVKTMRWTTEARAVALVPALIPDAEHVKLWLTPGAGAGAGDAAASRHVVVRWNGDEVASIDLRDGDGWTGVEFDVSEDVIAVGTNEIEIEAAVGADGKGVAVGEMDLSLVQAAPRP